MKISKVILILIAIYSIIFVGLLTISVLSDDYTIDENNLPEGMSKEQVMARDRAIMKMAVTLILLWIVVLGSLMYKFRDKVKEKFQRIPGKWQTKFVLFAILLALLEEVITVTITNLAPLYGSEIGVAFITASTNYLQVVLLHSVIAFVPMFIAWAFLLSRYDFKPAQVFLLFGLVGVLAEATISPSAFVAGFWFYVYGLMIYLPAYSLPERNVIKPKFRHYVLSIILPILFTIPVAIVVSFVKAALDITSFLG